MRTGDSGRRCHGHSGVISDVPLGGSSTTESDVPDQATAGLPPFAWRILVPLAGAKVLLQLVTANLYGAHRDEFYYLESGHHLAWGYVDNPPLVPVVYRLQEFVFGHSVLGLAVVPAILGGVYVILGGLLARELGGQRFAQLLTGVIAWLGSLFLTTSHFLSTVSFDLVFWALGSLLVLRMIRTGDRRLWMVIGVICGVGLMNKYTMGFWIVATLAGLLLTPQRRFLASVWLPVGAVIAGVIVAPNIAWEFAHHWPTLEFLRNIRAEQRTHQSRAVRSPAAPAADPRRGRRLDHRTGGGVPVRVAATSAGC